MASIAGDGVLRVSWARPATDGGAALTGYAITSDNGIDETPGAAARMRIVGPLTPGVTHEITMVAINDEGPSADSDPAVTITVATLPAQPQDVEATSDDGTAHVTWEALDTEAERGWSEFVGLKICPFPADVDCIDVGPDATSADFSELANGTGYTFQVQARNLVGLGPPSAMSNEVTPCGPPSPPLAVRASVAEGTGVLLVAWEEPAWHGGCTPLEYEVRTNEGSWVDVETDLSYVATGLDVGDPYHFTVRARNGAGTGPESGASTDVVAAQPPATPSAPEDLSWEPGDTVGRACWVPPADDGYSPITGYDLVLMPGNHQLHVDAPATCGLFTGLTCPQDYSFTVVAINDAGGSAESDDSASAGNCGEPSEVAVDVPEEVEVGDTALGFVFLNRLAGEGGVDVTLTNVTGDYATIPATVHVEEFETTASFPVTGVSSGTATIRATLGTDTHDDDVDVTSAGDAPFVRIDSPGDGIEVWDIDTPVHVTVEDDGTPSWTLSERLADDSVAWTTLETGTGNKSDDEIHLLDPTLMLNGLHELKLVATDGTNSSTTIVQFVVKGQQKVGHFSVSFVDMTVPLAGLPIQIIRTYDSRDPRNGDFGKGWRLSTSDVRLEVNRVIGEEWFQVDHSNPLYPYTPRFCNEELKKHVVTVTFPDGKVEQFRPIVEFRRGRGNTCNLLGGDVDTVRFVPVGNTRSKLEVTAVYDHEEYEGPLDEVTLENGSGVLYAGLGAEENVYDPIEYRLTTQDGTTYDFERTDDDPRQVFKLVEMADRNGNTLTFSADGIVAQPSGKEVWFNRPGQFITAVCDRHQYSEEGPMHCMTYSILSGSGYDLLWGVKDRSHENDYVQTHFRYHMDGPPYTYRLKKIIQPTDDPDNGTLASLSCYDDDGRLLKVCDGLADPDACADEEDFERCIDLSERDPNAQTQSITDRRGNTTILVYDDHGNVEEKHLPEVTEPWTYLYNDDDQVELETDPLGNTTRTTYDAHGHVAGVEKADAEDNVLSTTCFRWTEDGDLLATWQDCDVDPEDVEDLDIADATSRSTFDHHGNLVATADALGHGSTIVPDVYGNAATITDALQNVTLQAWEGNLLREETDASGVVTEHDYVVNPEDDPAIWYDDRNGNPRRVRRIDPDGWLVSETSSEFDADGRLTKSVAPDGSITETEYDDAGRAVIQRELVSLGADPDDPEDDVYRETETVYNELGQVERTNYPDGSFEEQGYDENGNVIWRTARRLELEPERISHTEYDVLNRPSRTWLGGDREDEEPPTGTPFVLMEYDDAGRLVSRTDERENTTTYEYDGAGRRTKVIYPDAHFVETHYDAKGRVWWTWNGDEDTLETVFVYDEAGRKIRECRLSAEDRDDADDETPPEGACKLTEHDALGQAISETDEMGKTTQFGHDELGRLTSVTDALGHITSYDFDDEGNMTAQHDALERVTHYESDVMGRRIARVLPLGQREEFEYGLTGAMTSRTDFMGRTTSYTIDAETDRVELIDYPNYDDVAFAYFGDGQRATVTIGSQDPTVYTYEESRGKLETVTHPDDLVISYHYDETGNRDQVTTPSGTTYFAFDTCNRLWKVSDESNFTPAVVYTPDPDTGALWKLDYPNDVEAEYALDDRGRLESLTWTHETTGIASFTYDVDHAGHRRGVVETKEGVAWRTVTYDYDELWRLTSEEYDLGSNSSIDRTIAFEYDAVGNRLRREDDVDGDIDYEYDDNDRLTMSSDTTYEWDDNGNLTHENGTLRYEWDDENRMTEAHAADDYLFTYDADGIRQTRTVGSEVTRFLVDSNLPYAQVLEERNGSGTLLASYLRGDRLLRRAEVGGPSSMYVGDALNSTRALVDWSDGDDVTDSYTYEGFGSPMEDDSPTVNEFRYTGEQWEDGLGLEYLRARWMQPADGTFASMDPIEAWSGFPVRAHRFNYAGSNPIAFLDPSGEVLTAGETAFAMGLIGLAVHVTWNAALSYAENQDGMQAAADGLDHALEGFIDGLALGLGWGSGTRAGAAAAVTRHIARNVPKDVASAFKGPIYRNVLREPVRMYRYWGGSSGEISHWLASSGSRTGIESGLATAKDALALPAGNTAAKVTEFIIPKGTEVLFGRVKDGASWALQAYVKDPSVLIKVGGL